MKFTDATTEEINAAMEKSWDAFLTYRKLPLQRRQEFMYAIANELDNIATPLVEIASQETNLPKDRLESERKRTVFQLKSYADACKRGDWLDARIDTAIPDKTPPKPDIRKMMVPLGPVVVFGASNFPFAYSTAGGDTACAFAAGCPVIVKAHPAHAETSEMVANAIFTAAKKSQMPDGIFAHIHGESFETGKALVLHPRTKAVGFTGSFAGGKALFDVANQRKEPIPVFSEMGSVNPVFLLPEKLQQSAEQTAKMYAASITASVGQFCTNPGILIGVRSEALDRFLKSLSDEIKNIAPGTMLHPGIAKAFVEKRQKALAQNGVHTAAVSSQQPQENQGQPTIATVSGDEFLKNALLHQEVFGPYSILVVCENDQQMMQVALHLEGQLTSTIIATENDVQQHEPLIEAIKNICGRFIMNGVPTGVEVCLSMNHGGPYPATTDSRFTSVGADGIKRFVRPISFQNWPDSLLPDELKNANPVGLWRTVNDELTKGSI